MIHCHLFSQLLVGKDESKEDEVGEDGEGADEEDGRLIGQSGRAVRVEGAGIVGGGRSACS